MDWIIANKEWLFGGAGLTVILLLGKLAVSLFRRQPSTPVPSPAQVHVEKVIRSRDSQVEIRSQSLAKVSDTVKSATRILFIDDDVKFKVVKILKNSGWTNTSLVKDVASLNDPALLNADIVFVDIQGVGVASGFKDEGLGLASAIKDKYPAKKLVIYSAEPKGAMFHEALKKADHSLEKNADPYEFERLVERFVNE